MLSILVGSCVPMCTYTYKFGYRCSNAYPWRRAPAVAMRAPLTPAACAALLLICPVSLVLCYHNERGYQAEDAYHDDALDVWVIHVLLVILQICSSPVIFSVCFFLLIISVIRIGLLAEVMLVKCLLRIILFLRECWY